MTEWRPQRPSLKYHYPLNRVIHHRCRHQDHHHYITTTSDSRVTHPVPCPLPTLRTLLFSTETR
ncbi:hypothetical protein E2C01_053399 [Portunus trituberculatus]|uniref:Uncharacterized protein n=1 Tax=Portunus trituberculatus TaxID=210409 RepID=A0A5B7GGG7_PORTR|nr:hypothetical protein [Portunus trituberculatus]